MKKICVFTLVSVFLLFAVSAQAQQGIISDDEIIRQLGGGMDHGSALPAGAKVRGIRIGGKSSPKPSLPAANTSAPAATPVANQQSMPQAMPTPVQQAAVPVAQPMQQAQPASPAKQPSITFNIYFKVNSTDLADSGSLRQIQALGRALTSSQLGNARFEIAGHTDSAGGDQYNLELSTRRAKAVKQILLSQFNISSGRLSTIGLGEMEPVATNATPEGRAKNRRVVITRLN
ncbi:MAG: OmpA family protein [Desulfovibrio sp.]